MAWYIITTPELTSAPPTMSLSQCTPEASLPMTIKAVKAAIANATQRLIPRFLMRALSCMIAVGITHSTSMVVDDGYDASRNPSIRTGR